MKTLFVIFALFVTTLATAQTGSRTFYFSASSAEIVEDMSFIKNDFIVIDSIVGYANTLGNKNGMSNTALAQLRADNTADVLGFTGELSYQVEGTTAAERKVVVYFHYAVSSQEQPAVGFHTTAFDQIDIITGSEENVCTDSLIKVEMEIISSTPISISVDTPSVSTIKFLEKGTTVCSTCGSHSSQEWFEAARRTQNKAHARAYRRIARQIKKAERQKPKVSLGGGTSGRKRKSGTMNGFQRVVTTVFPYAYCR